MLKVDVRLALIGVSSGDPTRYWNYDRSDLDYVCTLIANHRPERMRDRIRAVWIVFDTYQDRWRKR